MFLRYMTSGAHFAVAFSLDEESAGLTIQATDNTSYGFYLRLTPSADYLLNPFASHPLFVDLMAVCLVSDITDPDSRSGLIIVCIMPGCLCRAG